MLAQQNTHETVAAEISDHCALQAGDTLQLQFPGEPERGRYKVTVIGFVENCSLMITAPKKNGHILLLREGQQFVVRLLSGKQVIGFDSEVLKVYNNPFAYVHLKPPAQVQQCKVRNAYRVQVNNIASVQGINEKEEELLPESNKDTHAAKIIDISTTGCQLQVLKLLPDEIKKIVLSTRVEIAEQIRFLKLEAEICSRRECDYNNIKGYLYGIRFLEMNDDTRLLLNCFVYEKLVHDFFKD